MIDKSNVASQKEQDEAKSNPHVVRAVLRLVVRNGVRSGAVLIRAVSNSLGYAPRPRKINVGPVERRSLID